VRRLPVEQLLTAERLASAGRQARRQRLLARARGPAPAVARPFRGRAGPQSRPFPYPLSNRRPCGYQRIARPSSLISHGMGPLPPASRVATATACGRPWPGSLYDLIGQSVRARRGLATCGGGAPAPHHRLSPNARSSSRAASRMSRQ
jgi:hypothetical protein